MWLSHIGVSKVRAGVRSKLLAYQLEVVEVLSAWFLGVSDVPGLTREFAQLKDRLSGVEAMLGVANEAARMSIESMSTFADRTETLMRPFTAMSCDGRYMTVRAFATEYSVYNALGRRLTADEMRSAGRYCKELSVRMHVPVYKFDGPYGLSNAYRLDVLLYWRMNSDIQSRLPIETYSKLTQRRLFL